MTKLKVNRLPSLPHVLVDMLQACQGNRASFQEISLIISRDAAISARVISLANSTFYNRGTQINTIERALLVLGTDTVKTIVITASVQQFFSGFSTKHTQFLKHFWKRSLSCALIAKSLAILTSYPNPEEAYLTGLLHNIGELVLDSNYPKEFSELLLNSQIKTPEDETNYLQQENDTFSVNHAQVGAWLAKEWNLGDLTADAIEFHHAPSASVQDAHHLVKLIYLASHLSIGQLRQQYSSNDIAYQLFELNASLVNEIVSKIETEVLEVAATLGIKVDESKSDQQAQVVLAQHVRNIGLVQTATSELTSANSKIELGRAFQSTLELLFGYMNSVVFWHQESEQVLSFFMPEQPDGLPIKIKLEANRSIIAEAALSNTTMHSIIPNTPNSTEPNTPNNQLTVVDQQIKHLLKAQGLTCIPIQHKNTLFCVLVVGCNQIIEKDSNQEKLLKYFANEIAITCADTLKRIHADEDKVSSDELILRASEIAHEVNNPLNIISNYLTVLGQKFSEDNVKSNKDINEELTIVKEEIERASHILRRLKDLKHDSCEAEPGVNINTEIKNLDILYKNSFFLLKSITSELDLEAGTPRITASRNHLKQILTNLVKNAVEAMPTGGTLKIATTATVNVNGKDFVEIIIQDSGSGIPEHILKDLFTPVTSTKGNGHSGLGLSITKNLVKDAKGTISCRSNDNGTTFQILLPQTG